jgi:hypothetical protein
MPSGILQVVNRVYKMIVASPHSGALAHRRGAVASAGRHSDPAPTAGRDAGGNPVCKNFAATC